MSIPCSIGIFAENGSQLHYSYMVQGADAAMYQAKELGKTHTILITIKGQPIVQPL